MTLFERITKLPKWALIVVGVVWSGLTYTVGAVFTDYNGFRTNQNEAARGAVDAAREASEELTPLLVKFARFALNEGQISSEDRVEFDKIINKSNEKALAVKIRYPSVSVAYEAYSDALIKLKRSADAMKSPLTGKEFVLAVSKYSLARDNFNSTAENASSSYFGSFRFW